MIYIAGDKHSDFREEDIDKVLDELHYLFDIVIIEQAKDYYLNSKY